MAEDQGAERKEADGEAPALTGATATDEAVPTSADTTGEAAAEAKAESAAEAVPETDAAAAEAVPEADAAAAKAVPETDAAVEAKREPKAAADEAKAEAAADAASSKASPEAKVASAAAADAAPSKPTPEAKVEAKAEVGADPDVAREVKPASTPIPARRRASRLWWALPILMLVEFYVYGHNGRLEICVGKEGDTDFSLVGQERTDANRWKFPRCETRENLGLRSQRDERVQEGIEAACRGATIFRHQGESKVCVAGEQGWQHHVDGHFVPPWDPAYYRHLFWFLQ
jgi:hypothetical protein